MIFTGANVGGCANDPCHEHATCTEDNGSHSCKCNSGYSGDGYDCKDYCDDNTCGVDQFCISMLNKFRCICNDETAALVNGKCIKPGSSVEIVGLKLTKSYISDYSNSSSMAFKELAAEIESTMLTTLQSSNENKNLIIIAVIVTALRHGSVLADMTIVSEETSLPSYSVENIVNDGIANGNLSLINASNPVTVSGTIYFHLLLRGLCYSLYRGCHNYLLSVKSVTFVPRLGLGVFCS